MKFFRWIAKVWRSEAGQLARDIVAAGPDAIKVIKSIIAAKKKQSDEGVDISYDEFKEIIHDVESLFDKR